MCDLIGLIIEATGLEAEVGEVCPIETGRGRSAVPAEVVGFRAGRTLLMPLGDAAGIGPGARVTATGTPFRVDVADDAARPLARRPRPPDRRPGPDRRDGRVPHARRAGRAARPARRARASTSASTLGVRALDALVPCGRGQRLGIFAGSGVGKSSLLGMIARSTSRGRQRDLPRRRARPRGARVHRARPRPEGMARSVVVVATSDQPALVRIKAAFTATTIAEHFRDQGADVMLMMDSVTRFAMAQREIGLAIGEPPATRGYTPSVFALLPEAARALGHGADGLDHRPLHRARRRRRHERADRRRRALDPRRPRRALARARARRPLPGDRRAGQRLAPRRRGHVAPTCAAAGDEVRRLMAAYRDKEDLIAIGAYQPGTDPLTDAAIAARAPIEGFLRQRVDEPSTAEEADRGAARALAA